MVSAGGDDHNDGWMSDLAVRGIAAGLGMQGGDHVVGLVNLTAEQPYLRAEIRLRQGRSSSGIGA
jgi:hypothetical protein